MPVSAAHKFLIAPSNLKGTWRPSLQTTRLILPAVLGRVCGVRMAAPAGCSVQPREHEIANVIDEFYREGAKLFGDILWQVVIGVEFNT